MPRKLSELGELALVDYLRRGAGRLRPRPVRGIGDDAAVVLSTPGALTLLTTDSLVEGVHFDRGYTSPRELGYKSLTVNLSDIAAMGGTPRYALLSLALPGFLPETFLHGFFAGFTAAARKHRTSLIGGNLSAAPRVFISVTVLGESFFPGFLGRDGARPGDGVFVSGTPGAAALGLLLLARRRSRPAAAERFWTRKHLLPEPRIRLGRELLRRRLASAMLDLSDGIIIDLGRIARESRAAIEIETGRIEIPAGFAQTARRLGKDPRRLFLSGGEDYELAFTSPPEKWEDVGRLSRLLKIRLRRIGRVKAGRAGVTVKDERGKIIPVSRGGYEHFAKKR